MTIREAFEAALAHQKSGRLPDAEKLYRQILATKSNHSGSLHMLGLLAHQAGHSEAGIKLIQQAIELSPENPGCRSDLAEVLRSLRRFDEAIAECQRAIELRPDSPPAHNNLGNVLRETGRFEEASASYRRTVELAPGHPEGWCNLGNVLLELGRLEEAAAAFRRASDLRPTFRDALNNLGCVLRKLGKTEEAVLVFRQAIRLLPGDSDLHSNLAVALKQAGRIEEAVKVYAQATALNPRNGEAHHNLGNAFGELGRHVEAERAYARALEIDPRDSQSKFSSGILHLLRGDLDRGWAMCEARLEIDNPLKPKRYYSKPKWDGGDLRGRTLLIHSEQGFGDCIQFIRYAPLAAECGGSVIVECPAELMRTFSTIEGIRQFIPAGEPLPDYDVHCSMMSLPLVFGTTLESIPNRIPYLSVSPPQCRTWREWLGRNSSFPKVGIVWAGNPKHQRDRSRSLHLKDLNPLFEVTGVDFISLQMDERGAQLLDFAHAHRVLNSRDRVADFADTAALISQLDLVVAVDTSVAHLAGALGKPVWVMLAFAPDWRWLLDRTDSPWYPTMRLFRQQRLGEWEPVLARVRDELERFVRQRQPVNLLPTMELALRHREGGDLAEADDLLRRFLSDAPEDLDLLDHIGICALGAGWPEAAVRILVKASAFEPDRVATLCNLGRAFARSGRLEEAAAAFRRVVQLQPDNIFARNDLGNVLERLGLLGESLSIVREAIKLQPGDSVLHSNLGLVLLRMDRIEAAVESCRKAIALDPRNADAHQNLGNALGHLGRVDEALAACHRALELNPQNAKVKYGIGLLHLRAGRFEHGWPLYEERWDVPDSSSPRRDFPQPTWDGEQLAGKTLLIHAEQGLGDSVQFIRYAPLAAERCGRVVVECPAELLEIFSTIQGIGQLVAAGDVLPAFDFQIPMMTLPLAFRTTLENVPKNVPYLSASPLRCGFWRDWLAMHPSRLKAGLVWAGNPNHQRDRSRSLHLKQLLPLLDVPGVDFVSLQMDERGTQLLHLLQAHRIRDPRGHVADFADTAALISQLDVVVAVDTSVAHLAGALGTPVWVMLPFFPDWRWLVGRSDSPWYPTMRLFRQEQPGQWEPVIARVRTELEVLAQKRS